MDEHTCLTKGTQRCNNQAWESAPRLVRDKKSERSDEMADATKLTRENMKQLLESYYRLMPLIEGPQDEGKVLELLAPDFEARPRALEGEASVYNREQWAKRVCGHADRYRAYPSFDTPLGDMMIDEKEGRAVVIYKDEFKHPVTGELVAPPDSKVMRITFMTVWQLCIHDSKVKAKWEFIMRPSVDPLSW
jgi:hypothetical protein